MRTEQFDALSLHQRFAGDYDVSSFMRLCRHEQPLRDVGRAKREAEEAKRAAQALLASAESDPFGEAELALFL